MRRLASVGLTQPGWAVAQNFLVLQRVMIGVPATRYAKSGDVRVACQVTGTGPVDLVWAPGTASRLDLDWEWQAKARFLARLGAFSRLIRFDKRGTGLSDRPNRIATLEERTDDIRAVMDAAGSKQAAIFGMSEGSSMACVFAATYPDRTRSLVIWGGQARWVQTADYRWGLTPEDDERMIRDLEETGVTLDYVLGPGAGLGAEADPASVQSLMRYAQAAASPAAFAALERMNALIDVREILPTIRVPTLVLNRRGDPIAHVDAARDLASRIPGARFVEVPGDTHELYAIDPDRVLAVIEEFLTGSAAVTSSERVLATIVFIDLVGSTEGAAALGDAGWSDLLARYYGAAEREVRGYNGAIVDRAGDGLLATFDGPARAVRCASAIRKRATGLGLQVRAGIHSGEIEKRDGAIRGIAVHTAARIGGLARAGEVLVSGTVKDLVAGSRIEFENRCTHYLKGIPEPRQLYALGGWTGD